MTIRSIIIGVHPTVLLPQPSEGIFQGWGVRIG